MYPSIKREIPEFIEEYMVFCDCFIDINKQKTCWVLTRNLKFFEFYQKQLVASIDLYATCLSEIADNLQSYEGPKGKWYETSSLLPGMAENAQNYVSLGKYMFHALNVHKIYVIIHCWDKCIVLKRLPEFKGFEITAQYNDILSYRIIHGSIKFCPVVEFKFQSHECLNTDFEDKLVASEEDRDLDSKKFEMRQLLEHIRSAKTELQLHKSITAHSFHRLQNNLTLGQSFLRSIKLEEKQILSRCGDIWKRFTAHDDLIIGVPLVNQCAAPNLTIIHNLTPVIQTGQSPENSIQLQYRLFQLKLKFDNLDALETFLESEDEQLQGNMWSPNGDLQILPQSFVVLLIKLKISQIISLKESPLILNYEVVRHLDITADTTKSRHNMLLQLFLQNLDFHKMIFEERSQCELKFVPHTLHQDFLTIAMTSQETNLKITFASFNDLEIFEHFVQENLDFLKPTQTLDRHPDNNNFHLVFYNKIPSSLWFGSLIIRMKQITEDDSDHCIATCRIYCQSFDKTLLLIKTFLNDILTVKCNILYITNCDRDKKASKCVDEFENALRQELLQLQETVRGAKNQTNSTEHLLNQEKLCQLQMNSDIVAIDVMDNKINL